MGKRYLPSIEALTDDDDDRLIAELKVHEVREQVAVARSLLDAVEALSANEQTSVGVQDDAVEELARLGCKIVELAGAISRSRGPVSAVSPVQRAS
jgi:hypothetical protein